jgi:stearoyl-CoA desaturase (delta-9 desaturase)
MSERQAPRRPLTPRALPFFLVHLAPLALFATGWSWTGLGVMLGSYYLRMFGVTAGYHRYFSHRAFRTGRVMQFLLACLAQSSLQKGVLWWASNHRHHHWHSDKPTDIHSPVRHGFWWSHVGWIVSEDWEGTDARRMRDLTRFPELVWLDRWHLAPAIAYAIVLTLAFGWVDGLLWGFFLSTILLWHGTFTINSLCHVFGKRVYATTDTSRNSALLAALTLGEGWHNNHHYYQRSAAQGWRWYEVDPTYLVLRALQALRLVEGVGKPPRHVIEQTIDRACLARQGEGNVALQDAPSAIQEQIEALSLAADALMQRAEVMRQELRELSDWTRESFQHRMDALHESAALIRARAEQACEDIRQSRDRTLLAFTERVESIQETAQAVLDAAAQSPMAAR